MGRSRRIICPGLIYHVINRGNNQQAIFLEEEDYKHYLNVLDRFKRKYEFKLFAYCLMTNHVHLLIKVGAKGTISRIMQSITVAHTRQYHFKYRSNGHVWQGRFKSPIVSDDEYLLTVMQYIEQNPARAGLKRVHGDYYWSSYRLNTRIKDSAFVDRKENSVFEGLGRNLEERIQTYRDLIENNLEEGKLKAVRKSVKEGTSYISERFQKQMEILLPKKRKRGRPQKEGIII